MSPFKLSWEEFLEVHQGSLPSPSVASFVAVIFIAIAVGVFGVTLTYAVEAGERIAASSFCWMSVALFVLAFWDLRVRTGKRRARAVRELRATYDHYYAGERAFAFDDEQWLLETKSGKQEALWSGLLSAAETQSVITLSSGDQLSALVPKRILSPAELNSVQQKAVSPPRNSWASRVSLLDYLITEIPSLWRRHPFLMAEAHAGGLFFFGMIATDLYHTTGTAVAAGWALAGLFLFLTITAQFWYFLILYLTSHKELSTPWQVGFSEKGIYIRTTKVSSFSAWTNFRRAREAARCVLVYIDATRYYTFPKSCIPREQAPVFRQLLKAKLAGE